MMRDIFIGFLLFVLFSLISCNSCVCDKGSGLEGFYTCTRKATSNQEFLWLFKNKTYIHILSYDTVNYINSDTWAIKKDPDGNGSLFIAENWVSPCVIGRSYCFERMDKVTKLNFKDYKGSKAQLDYGCYKGLDDSCYFRLMDVQEPMYNYKRLAKETHKMDLSGKHIEFYTGRDSILFSNIIEGRIF
jgi:hypothetical protein